MKKHLRLKISIFFSCLSLLLICILIPKNNKVYASTIYTGYENLLRFENDAQTLENNFQYSMDNNLLTMSGTVPYDLTFTYRFKCPVRISNTADIFSFGMFVGSSTPFTTDIGIIASYSVSIGTWRVSLLVDTNIPSPFWRTFNDSVSYWKTEGGFDSLLTNDVIFTLTFESGQTYDNVTFALYLTFFKLTSSYSVSSSFLNYVSFDYNSYNNGYNAGYNIGYEQGFNSGVSQTSSNMRPFLEQSYDNGYNAGYSLGHTEGYNQGYQIGYQDGLAVEGVDNMLGNAMITVVELPWKMIKQILNFEVLGINFASLFLGLFTLVIVFWLLRHFS